MKASLILAPVLLACLGFTAAPTLSTTPITGDYVEARTASVFAGACHYNGELVTTGNDAIMAWTVSSGTWKGIDLSGVRAMAAVTSDANLKFDSAARKAELLVDASSAEQVSAFADMLHTKIGTTLGDFKTVRRGPVTFSHESQTYTVSAPRFAAMTVDPMPNGECCKQPSLIWYSPLTPLEHRKVGYTQSATYSANTLTDSWQRQAENSAFYGQFSF